MFGKCFVFSWISYFVQIKYVILWTNTVIKKYTKCLTKLKKIMRQIPNPTSLSHNNSFTIQKHDRNIIWTGKTLKDRNSKANFSNTNHRGHFQLQPKLCKLRIVISTPCAPHPHPTKGATRHPLSDIIKANLVVILTFNFFLPTLINLEKYL